MMTRRLPLRGPRLAAALLAALLCHAAGATPTAVPLVRDDVRGAPNIAVASSLRAVWPELARAWRETLPNVDARVSFGASRTLARQIARGAPFELFLSADEQSPTLLPAARLANGPDGNGAGEPGTLYALGRLALVMNVTVPDAIPDTTPTIVPHASAEMTPGVSAHTTPDPVPDPVPVTAADDSTLDRLRAYRQATPTLRLAIANPAHAPYGMAAREALTDAGLWPWPAGRLVLGENASQALQFLRSGAVGAALVPLSLALPLTRSPSTSPTTDSALAVHPVDARRHRPLRHRMVVLADASPAARALAGWLRGARARETLAASGFGAPP